MPAKETPRGRMLRIVALRLAEDVDTSPTPEAAVRIADDVSRSDAKVASYYLKATERAISKLAAEAVADASRRIAIRKEAAAIAARKEAHTATLETAKQIKEVAASYTRKEAKRINASVRKEAVAAAVLEFTSAAVYSTFEADALRLADAYRHNPTKLAETSIELRKAIRQRVVSDARHYAANLPAEAVAEASSSYNSAYSSKVSPSFDPTKLTKRGKLIVVREGSYYPSPDAEAVKIRIERQIKTVKPKRGYKSGSRVKPEAETVKQRIARKEADAAAADGKKKRNQEIAAAAAAVDIPAKPNSPKLQEEFETREARKIAAAAAKYYAGAIKSKEEADRNGLYRRFMK